MVITMERMRTGTQFLEMLWYFTADRIVNTAVNYYKLDEERKEALRRVFLREADYLVRVRKLTQ
jgi:hypothetical protein